MPSKRSKELSKLLKFTMPQNTESQRFFHLERWHAQCSASLFHDPPSCSMLIKETLFSVSDKEEATARPASHMFPRVVDLIVYTGPARSARVTWKIAYTFFFGSNEGHHGSPYMNVLKMHSYSFNILCAGVELCPWTYFFLLFIIFLCDKSSLRISSVLWIFKLRISKVSLK